MRIFLLFIIMRIDIFYANSYPEKKLVFYLQIFNFYRISLNIFKYKIH